MDRWFQKRVLNARTFASAGLVVNALRNLENADYGVRLGKGDLLTELHRIGYRQFPLQRGFMNLPAFYRSAFIYGQNECDAYFKQQNGLSINDFSAVGFALCASFMENHVVSSTLSLDIIGVSNATTERALKLLSINYEDARKHFPQMVDARLGVANQQSFLRRYPIIRFGENSQRLRTPMPQILSQRISSGIYYDIVGGGRRLLNEASNQFEIYTQAFIQKMLPKFQVDRSSRYKINGSNYDTSDVLVREAESIAVAVECKATKLTFQAQFGEHPMNEAKRVYDEIAKGVFQLWRYFSHSRRGAFGANDPCANAHGLVLTLDSG